MQNLIYLILIVLSVGAGYMAGSWQGRDAQKTLDVAKVGGEKIEAKRDTLQADLNAAIKAKQAEHDAELAKRQASYDAASVDFKRKLTESEVKANKLQQTSNVATQRANDLTAKLATAKPDEVPSLTAEIARLRADALRQQAEARGNVCLKETVPAEILAELRVEKL